MPSPHKPIGILGGTFDPVHRGHVYLARSVFQLLNCEEVRLIPCQQQPLKENPPTPAVHRVNMLKLAIADEPGLIVDECELQRPPPSYAIETLQQLRASHPEHPLCFIMGMDAFLTLPRWKGWEDIMSLAHLIVISRAGYTVPSQGELAKYVQQHKAEDLSELALKPAGKIHFLELPKMPLAAENIRSHIEAGKYYRPLVSDAVYRYIQEHGLYR